MDGYSIPDAARVLGVAPQRLREAIEAELVDAVRVAGRWRVPRDELERVSRMSVIRTTSDPRPSFPASDSGDDLDQLRLRVDELERRLAALESDPAAAAGKASMRPALARLFAAEEPTDG
jgi:hypothetical protein